MNKGEGIEVSGETHHILKTNNRSIIDDWKGIKLRQLSRLQPQSDLPYVVQIWYTSISIRKQ